MSDNTFTKNYSDGTTLNETQLDTAFKSLKPVLDNFTEATSGSTSGQVLKSTGSSSAPAFDDIDDIVNRKGPNSAYNYGFSTSVSSGDLTINLKTATGSDPSSNNPVELGLSGSGTTSVQQNFQSITSAKSVTISASSAMGFTSLGRGTTASKVYIYALQSGTAALKIGVSSRSTYGDGSERLVLDGSNGSDTINAIYSTDNVNSRARLIGAMTIARNSSNEWTNPTEIRTTVYPEYDVEIEANTIAAAITSGFDASSLTSGTIADARLPTASTSDDGIVQLNDSVNSSSTFQAATANAVKTAYIGPTDVGEIGTYAFLARATLNSTIIKGVTYAGSSLRYSGVNIDPTTGATCDSGGVDTAPSGTWRAMGTVGEDTGDRYPATLFLRIS